jgi:hypothetical protein
VASSCGWLWRIAPIPTQVSFGGQIVTSAGFVDGYQSVPDSGNHHCFVTRLPVLEVTTWQPGKFYLRAVRSDKEELHEVPLWAAAPGRPGLQKKHFYASTYMQQGYRCRRSAIASGRWGSAPSALPRPIHRMYQQGTNHYWKNSGMPHLDLVELAAVQKLNAAVKFDRGQITELVASAAKKRLRIEDQYAWDWQRRGPGPAQAATCEPAGSRST